MPGYWMNCLASKNIITTVSCYYFRLSKLWVVKWASCWIIVETLSSTTIEIDPFINIKAGPWEKVALFITCVWLFVMQERWSQELYRDQSFWWAAMFQGIGIGSGIASLILCIIVLVIACKTKPYAGQAKVRLYHSFMSVCPRLTFSLIYWVGLRVGLCLPRVYARS